MTTYAGRAPGGRTPWHLWLVGGIGVLWNGFGVFDFFMTLTQGDAYLRSMGMTDPQIAYFVTTPAWAYVAWALGVISAFAGAVLLLMRRRWAVHAFALSLVGLVLSALYTVVFSEGSEVMASTMPMQIVVWAGALFFAGYAWFMAKRGVLR